MQLIMTTEIEQLIPERIDFNYDDLVEAIRERTEHYRNLVVTRDDLAGAKKDRAALNSLARQLKEQRISQERIYMKPFDVYKGKVNTLIQMVEEPSKLIDQQIRSYEAAAKEQKRKEIKEYFDEQIGDLVELLPLERVWNEKWLNATYKMGDIQKEIQEAMRRVQCDIEAIVKMQSAYTTEMMNRYVETLDLGKALAEKARCEQMEQQRKQVESRVLPLQKQKPEEPEEPMPAAQEAAQKQEPARAIHVESTEAEPLEMLDFRVWVTPEQKQALKEFIKQNKIRCGRVPTWQTA